MQDAREKERNARWENERAGRIEGKRVVDVAVRYLARRSLTEGAARMEG